jgi:hypothetical protein
VGPVMRRGVSFPRLLFGVLLVLGCALAGAMVVRRVDTRVAVLATARQVGAGQVLTDADLTVVRVAAGSGLATVPDSRRDEVLGRTAVLPLLPGSLLSPGQVGQVAWPPAGQSVVALAVKAGHAPNGLTAGLRVTVLIVSTSTSTGSGSGTTSTPATSTTSAASATGGVSGGEDVSRVVRADATVVAIREGSDQSGTTLVSLLLVAADAIRVACAPGDAALVQLGVGR